MPGSGEFRSQPRSGTELEGQLSVVTDRLGQPARFVARLDGNKVTTHPNVAEKPHAPPRKNERRGHLCKPRPDTDPWPERETLEARDRLCPAESLTSDVQGRLFIAEG